MKFRIDFVSNSSSCSSVCINKTDWKRDNIPYALLKLQKASGFGLKLVLPTREIGEINFEWELKRYHSLGTKLNVCAVQLKYMQAAFERYNSSGGRPYCRDGEIELIKRYPEFRDRFFDFCRDKLNVEVDIRQKSGDPDDYDDNYLSGSIDHESTFPSNMEMFETDENLEAFLLNENSYWQNANDNSDYEYDEVTDEKVWPEGTFEEEWET